MDPLSITASIITVLEVASKVLFTCYEYRSAVKNASKELERVIEEIKSLRNVLEMLEQLAGKTESARLPALKLLSEPREGPLAKCLVELGLLNQKLTPPSLSGKSRPRNALIQALCWPLKGKDIEKTLANIGRFKAKLTLALSHDQITSLLAIEDLARTTQDTSLSLQKELANLQVSFLSKNIHTWLSAPDPSSNYQRALGERHMGTGIWFLKSREFAAWKTKPNSFLWLYGKTGCGKSILASTIIENVMEHCHFKPEMAVAFFYFDFADNEKQKCENMIRSLITQLSTQNMSLPQALTSLYSSCADGKTQPTLNSLLLLLCKMIGQFQEVFIVFDALDECGEKDKLLSVIEEIAGWKTDGLHVLATSRKESDIEERMELICEEQDRVGVHGVPVYNDICTYVHNKIQTDTNLKRWQGHAEVQKHIEETLISNADGMFQWVTCQLDSLKGCLTPFSLRKALRSLPKTLDETYARILCKIDERNCPYALRILQWLTHSIRPISLAELAEALVVDVNEDPRFDVEGRFPQLRELLTICPGLVTTATETEDSSSASTSVEVKLAHCSIKEYLVSIRIRDGPAKAYSIQEGYANAYIAETCLAYLLQFDKSDSLISQPLEDFPLALYAAEYWTHHVWLAASETSIYPLLSVELLVGKKDAFLNWVRLCDIDHLQNSDLTEGLDKTCPSFYCTSITGLFKPVRLLLDRGADVYAQGGRYRSAVDVASRLDYESVVRILLEKGAEVNAQGYHDPLLLALGHAFDNVMHCLFVNANAQNGNWRNALSVASFMNNMNAVQLLLDKSVDVNAQGDERSSALRSASCAGHKEVVQLLLDNGADVNGRSQLYGSPLQMASYWGHENVMRLLLDKGADINAVGGAYGNALAAASSWGHEGLVRLLLDKGADVNAHDGRYGNALQTATFFNSENVIRLLLEKGADVNDQGGYYGNPLMTAIWLDRKKVAQLLFDNGADISTLDEEALTKAVFLFNIVRCSDSCMRRKLTSMLMGDVLTTDCEPCEKMSMGD